MSKYKVFTSVLNTIVNDDIREFCIDYLKNTPDWFYEEAASSTGKYHPFYAVAESGPGGLARHTIAATMFLNWFLSLEQYSKQFNEREQDLLRVAIMLHDSRKRGKEEDGSKHTVFMHPIYAADAVKEFEHENITAEEKEFIGACISSHMGQWNTDKRDKKAELPKPISVGQELVHLADYLASRKDIDIHFDENIKIADKPTSEEYRVTFGKYKGETIEDIHKKDPYYISWLKEQSFISDMLRQLIKDM